MSVDFLNLSAQITGYLRELTGEDWELKPGDYSQENNAIGHADGRKITLQHNSWKGNLEVAGHYPDYNKYIDYFRKRDKHPRRRMSVSRHPHAIATEINKFFLADYNELYRKCAEMKLRDEAAEKQQKDLYELRSSLIRQFISGDEGDTKRQLDPDNFDKGRYAYATIIRYDTGSVDIRIHNLRDDLLEATLTLLTSQKMPYVHS